MIGNDAADHEAMRDLVAVAALGALEQHDVAAVRVHLAGCDECRAEYAALRAAANTIALAAETTLTAEQTQRMQRRLHAAIEPPVRMERRARPSYAAWMGGLVAAAALVFAFITAQHERALRGDLAADAVTVASAGARLDAANARLAAERAEIADLAAPDAEHYPVAEGTIVRRAERLYVAEGRLPELPHGKVYQAWIVSRGSPAIKPSITFSPGRGEPTIVRLPGAARQFVAVALSVEPAGGSKAPTSKPLFLRKLG